MGGSGSFLTSSSEVPRVPAEDLIESRRFTTAGLAADFAEFAEDDELYRDGKLLLRTLKSSWLTKDETLLSIEFNALHCHEDESYKGEVYSIELEVTKSASQITDNFRQQMVELDFSLPDNQQLRSLSITYLERFVVSQYVTLGWHKYRDHDMLHDQDIIDGPGKNFSQPCVYKEELEDGEEDNRPKYFLGIRRTLEQEFPPEVSPEKELGDSYVDKEDDFMASVEVEVNLNRAREIFRILQEGNILDLDLLSILPPEAIELKNKSKP